MIRWAASSEFGTYRLCEQQRFRRACASAQSRQNLRCSRIQTVSQGERSDRKPDPWPFWMAGHAQLKFVMTECSKTQIRLTGLRYFYHVVMFLLKIVRARKCKYIVYINMSCYFITQKLYFHQDAISSHLSQLVIKNNVSIFTLQNPPTNPSRKSFFSRGTLQSIKVFVCSCHLSLWPILKFLSIGTGRSAHTVQTHIRLGGDSTSSLLYSCNIFLLCEILTLRTLLHLYFWQFSGQNPQYKVHSSHIQAEILDLT